MNSLEKPEEAAYDPSVATFETTPVKETYMNQSPDNETILEWLKMLTRRVLFCSAPSRNSALSAADDELVLCSHHSPKREFLSPATDVFFSSPQNFQIHSNIVELTNLKQDMQLKFERLEELIYSTNNTHSNPHDEIQQLKSQVEQLSIALSEMKNCNQENIQSLFQEFGCEMKMEVQHLIKEEMDQESCDQTNDTTQKTTDLIEDRLNFLMNEFQDKIDNIEMNMKSDSSQLKAKISQLTTMLSKESSNQKPHGSFVEDDNRTEDKENTPQQTPANLQSEPPLKKKVRTRSQSLKPLSSARANKTSTRTTRSLSTVVVPSHQRVASRDNVAHQLSTLRTQLQRTQNELKVSRNETRSIQEMMHEVLKRYRDVESKLTVLQNKKSMIQLV